MGSHLDKLHLERMGLLPDLYVFLCSIALCVSVSPDCCERKVHNGDAYVLIENGDTSGFPCKDGCIYEKVGDDGQRFCFKDEGSVSSSCHPSDVCVFCTFCCMPACCGCVINRRFCRCPILPICFVPDPPTNLPTI